jgi:hypothetical protein
MSETATDHALSCSVEVFYTLTNVLDVFRESLEMKEERGREIIKSFCGQV